MEDINYEIVDSVSPDDRTWLEWKSLVESEEWTSDDLSVLTLTPRHPSTRLVLARKKTDGSFIGCVIWNEYDDIAYIGFYLMLPEHRGKGIGSIIWKHALERIPKRYTVILRAVPYMITRYKSRDTMEDINYEIVDSVSPDDRTWLEWKSLVESEEWTSDDLSVLTLTPRHPSTRLVLARKKTDGSFIGCVIWNEYDDIAYIGFYLMLPEHRGKGIGSIIWKHALERIPKRYTVILRAVPYMITRYKSRDTPFEGPSLHAYQVDKQALLEIADKYTAMNYVVRKVSELTKEEYRQLEQFDLSVVKRDRSDFLRRFHDLPFTIGTVLFNSENKIVACAAICPTLHSDRHLYKLAPLYASSLQEAFTVIKPLIAEVKDLDDKACFVLQILSGTIGSELFPPLFTSMDDVSLYKCGVSLFNRNFENPIDKQRLFIPHNNSCHFDS